jgi:hypothetical protein
MTSPNDRVTVDGQTLTRRVWALIADASAAVGLSEPVAVGQGGYKGGGGASASAGTHDGGDVFDLRISRIPESKWVPLNTELRKRNVCAWVRSPEYGWTSTGPHLHGVVRDSHDPLSPGARKQVENYDDGLNGLANEARDPFPRPAQHPYVMGAAPATDDKEDDDMPLIVQNGRSKFRLITGDRLVAVSPEFAQAAKAAGVKIVPISDTDLTNLTAALGPEVG